MINAKRIVVVMPAYNAAKTLEATVRELPDVVDHIILVDDHSTDETAALAHQLGLTVVVHEINRGYGANQKTCYSLALAAGADVVVMVHPDYQYSPLLVTPMAGMVAYGVYDLVLGSRILGGQARHGGMPLYKYFANRALTLFQNSLLGAKLSEYHTGFRAYTRELLLALPLAQNSDDFVFDNQVIAEALLLRANIGEISCPTRYFPEASSINLRRSIVYGWGVIWTTLLAFFAKHGLFHSPLYDRDRRLVSNPTAGGDSDAGR
jgi:glycosyltransferase involved in cell wall biosynthesis